MGSIAYWDSAPADAQHGHVAFVTAVNDDGAVQVEEYNYNYHTYSKRTIEANDNWYPDSFIHVQYER